MASDVGECLLKYPKEGDAGVLVEVQLLAVSVELNLQARTLTKLLKLPFQRGHQAEIIQQRGPELGSDTPDGLNGLINRLLEAGEHSRSHIGCAKRPTLGRLEHHHPHRSPVQQERYRQERLLARQSAGPQVTVASLKCRVIFQPD